MQHLRRTTVDGRIRVLLVEDDPEDRTLVARCIARAPAGRLELAATASRLQDLSADGPPEADVALLDLTLPDGMGVDTVLEFRRLTPDLPVVVLTGHRDGELARLCVANGADDYLPKDHMSPEVIERVLEYALERAHHRAAVRASRRTLDQLAAQTSDGVFLRDPAGDAPFTFVNDALTRMVGTDADTLLRDLRPLTNAVHPDDHLVLESLLEDPAGNRQETVRLRAGGRWVSLHIATTATRRADGSLVLVGTAHDVTRLEEARRTAEEAFDQLGRLTTLRTNIIRSVSHQLRTPLTLVLGFAKTLRSHGHELSRREVVAFADRIAAGAERLDALVEDLRVLTRRARALEPTQMDVAARVAAAATDVDLGARHLELPTGPVTGVVDGDTLDRIVEQLLRNVASHTPEGTTARVRVGTADDGIELIVDDDGPGMEVPVADRAFDPFEQGENAAESPSPGLGIGLTIVANLARLHGGEASVRSRRPSGTSVRVRLGEPVASHLGAGQVGHGPPHVVDPLATRATIAATTARAQLLGARSPSDALVALVRVVVACGGRLTFDASAADALPVNLNVGTGPEMHPAAPAGSTSRLLLERHLGDLLPLAWRLGPTVERRQQVRQRR